MVVVRAEVAGRASHAGREHGDVEAQGAQQGGEEAVELVAEAAPAARHDLLEEGLVVQSDRLSPMNAQVFERDGNQVRQVQPPQGLGGGSSRALVSDTFEIGGDVHGRALRNSFFTSRW